MASPIRLMRRSIRNTPTGGAPSASAKRADQRAAHEFEVGERRDQGVVEHKRRHAASTAQASACSSNASHMRRALLRFSAVKTSRVAPQATGSRASSRLCGKRRFHQIDVVQGCKHRALFAVPAPHQVEKVGRGFGVDGGERLVEHDQLRILQQQAGEQHALHLTAGERADRCAARIRSGRPRRWRLRSRRDLCCRSRQKASCRRHSPIATMS